MRTSTGFHIHRFRMGLRIARRIISLSTKLQPEGSSSTLQQSDISSVSQQEPGCTLHPTEASCFRHRGNSGRFRSSNLPPLDSNEKLEFPFAKIRSYISLIDGSLSYLHSEVSNSKKRPRPKLVPRSQNLICLFGGLLASGDELKLQDLNILQNRER